MARKNKKAEGVMGDGVLDLRHTGVMRPDIPHADIETRGEIAKSSIWPTDSRKELGRKHCAKETR
jgi:hypothetical protein